MQNKIPLHILCYHRVLEDETDVRNVPYFHRGTAISTHVFKQHILDLKRGFDCLDEKSVIDVLHGKRELNRPACWITFDDGYTDVAQTVHPILREANVPASLFVSTQVLDGVGLPADRWYAALNSAQKRSGYLLGLGNRQFDLDDIASLKSLIHGKTSAKLTRGLTAPSKQAR